MALDKTMFWLMAMYEHPIVPISRLRKDFFSHLSLDAFIRKLKSGEIPMPILPMGGDSACEYGVHIQDVSAYIDKMRAEGKAAYERGELLGLKPEPKTLRDRGDRPYTPKTLATEWKVSANHVRNLIKSGELAHFKIGRLLRISASAAREYEQRHMTGP